MRGVRRLGVVAALALVAAAGSATAHFLVLQPSTDVVTAEGKRRVAFEILFTHPMEQAPVMEMGKPKAFGVKVGDETIDLLDTLQPVKRQGKTGYTSAFTPKRPGDHVFFFEPAPYWEPAEGVMIVHYTKVVVNVFGEEEGWDACVGLPVEIEPLVRPYGLWAGNVFRGIVRKNGVPVPYAEVEVEYWNEGGAVKTPNDAFITQVVKADGAGVFSYALPRAGWWAFAALVEGDAPMKNPEGEEVGVELGGLLWVRAEAME